MGWNGWPGLNWTELNLSIRVAGGCVCMCVVMIDGWMDGRMRGGKEGVDSSIGALDSREPVFSTFFPSSAKRFPAQATH